MDVFKVYESLTDQELLLAIEEIKQLEDDGFWPSESPVKQKLIEQIKTITGQNFSQSMTLHKSCISKLSMLRFLQLKKHNSKSNNLKYMYGEVGCLMEEKNLSLDQALKMATSHSMAVGSRPLGVWDQNKVLRYVLIEGEVFKKEEE